MAGTKAGAKKAAQTNIRLYGADFYKNMGRLGGQNGHTGGFAANHELSREAGRKGGAISRRGPAKRVTISDNYMASDGFAAEVSKYMNDEDLIRNLK